MARPRSDVQAGAAAHVTLERMLSLPHGVGEKVSIGILENSLVERCLVLATTSHREVCLPLDDLFSCEVCDHPATDHGVSGCGLCSCVNPLEALVYSRSDVGDSESRDASDSDDGLRSA